MTELKRLPRRFSNGILLMSLLTSLILLPFLEHLGSNRLLLRFFMTVTIAAAIFTNRQGHSLRIPVLVLASVSVPVAWISAFVDSLLLFRAHCLLFCAFFGISGGLVILACFRQRFATLDAVLGAISAYLLIGLSWSFAYWAIAQADAASFSWPPEMMVGISQDEPIRIFPKVVYYSMVTMSTLGYGDITPLSSVACTLAWIQSVTGQFYVAVLVAWLVSALPRPEVVERELHGHSTHEDP